METVLVENEPLFTPKQVADAGILSLATQYELRRSRQLSFIKVDGSILYSQKHLDRYFASWGQKSSNQTAMRIRGGE
ncbi:MAG TPA: hypothetical protein VF596_04810 [Pyrinomonadaceae bacterium]|jgi:hypothetical protein